MRKKYLIIGDDARQEYLAKFYETIPFNGTDKDLKKQIRHNNIIILPIGVIDENINTSLIKYAKKGSTIISGNLSCNFIEALARKGCKILDVAKNKKFAEQNAIPTVLEIEQGKLAPF